MNGAAAGADDLMWRFANALNAAPAALAEVFAAAPDARLEIEMLSRGFEQQLGFPDGAVEGIQLRSQGTEYLELHLVAPSTGLHAAIVIHRPTGHLYHPVLVRLPAMTAEAAVSAAAKTPDSIQLTGQRSPKGGDARNRGELEIAISRSFNLPDGAPGYRFTFDHTPSGELWVTLWFGRAAIGQVKASRDLSTIVAQPDGIVTQTSTNNFITKQNGKVHRVRFVDDPSKLIVFQANRPFLLHYREGRVVQTPITELSAEPHRVTFLMYQMNRTTFAWEWVEHRHMGDGILSIEPTSLGATG